MHISPNATLCGTVTVGELTHIGAGATVRNNLNICAGVVLGMHAGAVRDIEVAGVYIGTPTQRIN